MNYRKVTGMSNPYLLEKGPHKTSGDGRCAMEFVAYLAGEPHTDEPACVGPVLREFCVDLNDTLGDEQRQRMRPYLARMIGTAGDGLDVARGWLCVDWLVREYVPAFLDLVPDLREHASELRALPEVRDGGSLVAAKPVLAQSRAAAGDAAWDAARAAVMDVARAAVMDAARAAAWDAARAAAGAVAKAAAGAVAKAAVRDVAGAAARDVAGAALGPAVSACQDSILRPGGLLDRMLPTELIQVPVVSEWREIVGSRG